MTELDVKMWTTIHIPLNESFKNHEQTANQDI